MTFDQYTYKHTYQTHNTSIFTFTQIGNSVFQFFLSFTTILYQ